MNLSKSYEFFQPEMCNQRVHIIGCGSVGSTLAENLARFGITKFVLYDFDKVEAHNIANQMFTQKDVGKLKVEALADILYDINPEIKKEIKIVRKGYTGQTLSGYVFLAVDNIDLRREICEKHKNSKYIKAIFDFRTRLTDAQHYAADWLNENHKTALLNSMNFTHEEAAIETPVSACNVTLGVCTTVRLIVAEGVNNFINFVKDGQLKKLILIDAFNHIIDAF